jgi:signal transduction histidine kinase
MLAILASFLRQTLGAPPCSALSRPGVATSRPDSGTGPLALLVHDLRNHLSLINANAAMIHHRLPAGVADQEYDDLCQSVEHAAALIHGLWENNATSAAAQPVDMNRVITLASDTLARVAGDRILLRRDLSVAPVPIIADVADIERILLNLVLNARDAMPEGGCTDHRNWGEPPLDG